MVRLYRSHASHMSWHLLIENSPSSFVMMHFCPNLTDDCRRNAQPRLWLVVRKDCNRNRPPELDCTESSTEFRSKVNVPTKYGVPSRMICIITLFHRTLEIGDTVPSPVQTIIQLTSWLARSSETDRSTKYSTALPLVVSKVRNPIGDIKFLSAGLAEVTCI